LGAGVEEDIAAGGSVVVQSEGMKNGIRE